MQNTRPDPNLSRRNGLDPLFFSQPPKQADESAELLFLAERLAKFFFKCPAIDGAEEIF